MARPPRRDSGVCPDEVPPQHERSHRRGPARGDEDTPRRSVASDTPRLQCRAAPRAGGDHGARHRKRQWTHERLGGSPDRRRSGRTGCTRIRRSKEPIGSGERSSRSIAGCACWRAAVSISSDPDRGFLRHALGVYRPGIAAACCSRSSWRASSPSVFRRFIGDGLRRIRGGGEAPERADVGEESDSTR